MLVSHSKILSEDLFLKTLDRARTPLPPHMDTHLHGVSRYMHDVSLPTVYIGTSVVLALQINADSHSVHIHIQVLSA